MYPLIGTIYTIPIYSYGTAIAFGLMLLLYCIRRDPYAPSSITSASLDTITLALVAASFIGGKLFSALSLATHTEVTIWDAIIYSGLSITGSVIAGSLTAIGMILYHNLPLWNTLDLFARHAPIMHICGRVGCFLAGCCYGCSTHSSWSIIYTDPMGWAPLYKPLHPVQLYAAAWHVGILLMLWGVTRYVQPHPGTVTALYISAFAIGRCTLDVLRADYSPGIYGISLTQGISIIVLCIGIILLYTRYYDTQQL